MPGRVITDYQMEPMNGLAMQEELAKRDIFLPVILISGLANISIAVQAAGR